MKIIKPSVEVVYEPNVLKHIERVGRVAWQSEDKICDGSEIRFYEMLCKRGHTSVLEHARLCVKTTSDEATKTLANILRDYEHATGLPCYIRNVGSENLNALLYDNVWSGNLRAWRKIAEYAPNEPVLRDAFDKKYLFDDIFKTERTDIFEAYAPMATLVGDARDEHRSITFKITCSRAVANEFVRHRIASFTQSSTRYINYSDELPIIEPFWFSEAENSEKTLYINAMIEEEMLYKSMFDLSKPQPQKSRAVLPCDTACTLCMTATVEHFKKYILPLRADKAAHPDIQIVANLMKDAIDIVDKQKMLPPGFVDYGDYLIFDEKTSEGE